MSLNNINLSPSLLVDLYATTLIETDAMSMPEPKKAGYLGENKKGILIVVNNPEVAFVSDQEITFLTSILTACKHTLADTAIVNKANHNWDYTEWNKILKTQTIMLFGVLPSEFGLPINFPHYQVQEFAKQTFIAAPPLSAIERDKEAKKHLWNSLRKHFGL